MSATVAARTAAARKGWESRRRLAAARAFIADGTPIGEPPERGTARGDYSPSELMSRIRAAEEGRRPGDGDPAAPGRGRIRAAEGR